MPDVGSSNLHSAKFLHQAGTISAAQAAATLAAAFGCLQPAIDPVFLTLLSEAGPLPLAAHGLIVGGTQAGAALGALTVWRFGHALPERLFAVSAALGCLFGLLSAAAPDFTVLLGLRCLYGAVMGTVYAHAMALSAAQRPSRAYSGMLLLQLLLATLVSLVLPALAEAQGPRAALALLALVPAAACIALLLSERHDVVMPALAQTLCQASLHRAETRPPISPAGWALTAATFCFICATMQVWSFAGALAAGAGIREAVIGQAVALGSLAGAATAMATMRERIIVPLPITALLSGLMIASPVVLTGPGAPILFTFSIILLNIGSTALFIRCSGLATATSRDSRFRTLVACTHSLGMMAGPAAGSALMVGSGSEGLLGGVMLVLAAGFAASLFAAKQGVGTGSLRLTARVKISATNSRQSA